MLTFASLLCDIKVRFHKPSINFGFAFKNSCWEGLLERRFSSWALAVLPEELGGFPAPSCWLTTFSNPSSRRFLPSSGFHHAHAWGINTHAGQTPIHMNAGRGEKNLWWGLTLWIRLARNYVVQSGLGLAAVLLQPPKCQDYMHASPCPASISLFLLHLDNQLFATLLSYHSHLTKHPG